jgi:hypothetical protein
MRSLSTVTALSLVLTGCSSTPAVIPTKNLEHPSDMTFVCVQEVVDPTDGLTKLSGQPMDACHKRDEPDPTVTLSGSRNIGTFAFVANPGRNEIAVADMDRARLLDLTPLTPGYGLLPAGGNPEAIASSQDGCWVATANRTTCDFTLIDPAHLLAPTFSSGPTAAVPASGTPEASRRVAVRTGSGRVLNASTGEIAFLPSPLPAPLPDGTPGSELCLSNNAHATPRAVATFPGCDMVALLDFSFVDPGDPTATTGTAKIVSAFYVRPDLPGGFLDAGTDPVCPTDCEPAPGATGLDAGTEAGDGGIGGGMRIDGGAGGQSAPFYLQPLALVPDGTRVYVGSLLDTAITSLDIGSSGLSNPSQISLADNPIGVTRLRLGIDPYRKAPVTGADGTTGYAPEPFLQNRGKFLYAITRDDSIRVVSLDQTPPVECDVNIVSTDPSVANPAQGCFPVGSKPRRPLAQGPGIRIPTFANPNSPPPLPRDISFAELTPPPGDGNIHSLSGQFGFIVASSGQVYVLNLDPTGENVVRTTPAPDYIKVPPTATNSFREARDVGKEFRTPQALTIAPQRQVIISDQAFPTTATYSAIDGPLIRSFSPDNGITTNWMDFPDQNNLISRSWSVIWEGALPQATRASGIVQSATDGMSTGVLRDTGADFCTSGAQVGDVLMFSGCTQNSDCQPDNQFTCQVAVSGARGMCLPIDSTASAKLIDQCGRFIGSRMRYEIAQATTTTLSLRLKLDEVPKTSLNPCQQDADCRPDVDHGKLLVESPDGGASPDAGVSRGFECVPVRTDEPRRCVKKCNSDSDCRAGHVCELVPWTDPAIGRLCVEAPLLTPEMLACFPQPMTSYSVRAGHSFMVYGSSMPTISGVRASSSGICQPQPPADPSLVARIPLSAPRCPTDSTFLGQAKPTVGPDGRPVPAPFFVQQLTAQVGRNPCLYQGSHTDGDTTVEAGVPDDHVRAFFQNPQIRFVMTNLDQYAGDLLAIHFELQYGYVPLTVQIPSYEVLLTMGTRIVTGPLQTPESPIKHDANQHFSFPYLYVVDQGRTALTPGSRGQVLRINPRAGSNEIASFDTTLSGSTPFQLQ